MGTMSMQTDDGHWRHARMRISSAVLMMHGADAWSSEIEDISATGVLVIKPEDWNGHLGDQCATGPV